MPFALKRVERERERPRKIRKILEKFGRKALAREREREGF